jgi:uncharacterized membrane protein
MSDRLLQRSMIVLSLVGIGIAGYLTYIHARGFDPACTFGGCERVQNSEWAKLAGVPVPYIGLAGYVGILAGLLIRGELARLAVAGMTYIGFAFSMYLTYREIFDIRAICQWCVGSAVVMTLLAILATIRALKVQDDDLYDDARDLPSDPEHEPA